MPPSAPPEIGPSTRGARERALGILAAAAILASLYFARDVLVPFTLAVILSLLVAPLVRTLRRFGLGHTPSVLTAVLVLAVSFAAVAVVIGSQLVRMTESLPQYERTIELKLKALNDVTAGKFDALARHAARLTNKHAVTPPPGTLEQPDAASSPIPIPVEVHQPAPNPLQVMGQVAGSLWAPIETAGIVLLVLIFVLLEREALRDRFIRIAGGTDIRLTTFAINDAGERLSRFFVSQFAVNFGLGVVLWMGLGIIGLPHPLLWAALAAVLRFVPYIGVWIAALCAVLLAAAVDPGWSLALTTLGLFVVVEAIAGQLVEPQLYGHSTGLSPLSVVIAAIFWSWLWGPIGLIVSTPLTLCLLVAGRHIKTLSMLDVLLGDTPALTLPEGFYQRALSADSAELIAGAKAFLKRDSFANYCDRVLLPAAHLAIIDLRTGAIGVDQLAKVRSAIVAVLAAIDGESYRRRRRNRQDTVLAGANAGRLLRQMREQVSGRWQGPLKVPARSVMVCVSLGAMADDLTTEILVRILRHEKRDARHVSFEDLPLAVAPSPEAAEGVSIVYIVSGLPGEERKRGQATAEEMRRRFPHACIVAVFLPGLMRKPDTENETLPAADFSASSLSQAVQFCIDMHVHAPPSLHVVNDG
jgi:predicted PurR-regulated permease PerM